MLPWLVEEAQLFQRAVSKSCESASFTRMIKNERPPITFFKPLFYAAAFLQAGLLLPFVWLRETPHFWTNAGGYPLWLRDLVLISYYPLLLVYVGLLSFLSWLLLCQPARSVRGFCAEAILLGVLWLVVALVAMLMLANNIANVIDGRPLHDH